MAPKATSIPIIMSVLTTISAINTSIYAISNVYFVNETLAFTTVDIN
jgi:hypothetical protein